MAEEWIFVGLEDGLQSMNPVFCRSGEKARDLFEKIGIPQMVEQMEGWIKGLEE